MSSGFPTPPKYLDRPGEPSAASFKLWAGIFTNYLYLNDRNRRDDDKLTDADKNHYLFSLLGTEGCRMFSSHPLAFEQDTTPHPVYAKAVRDLFDKPVNKVRAPIDFFRRNQAPHETTAEFLAALRTLAADCDFEDQEAKFLAIQLVNGCHNSTTRLKLLEELEPNLERISQMMQAAETAQDTDNHLRSPNTVGAVHRKPSTPKRKPSKPTRPPSPGPSKPCAGCGQTSHRYKSTACRAANSTCNHCRKVGHFEKCCRQKANGVKQAGKLQIFGASTEQRRQCFQCQPIVCCGEKHVPVTMTVDSGSDITTMTSTTYNEHFCQLPLSAARDTIQTYDAKEVKGCIGTFKTEFIHDGRSAMLQVYVLPDHCQPLLGVDAMQGLRLQLNPETLTVSKLNQSTCSSGPPGEFQKLLTQFPNLTADGMGQCPDFQHKIQLAEDAQPRAVKLRPIPLSRRDAVEKEVLSMVEQDIWEPVQQWAHTMVTVPKPNGDVRVTTDLTNLNNYVVPDRFPLPNIQELFLELQGAKYFTKLDLKKAYFNITLAPESRPLTTTMTRLGMFQYKRLPMGLKDSASVFQRYVSQTLAGIDGCIVYVDDIVIFGRTKEEHDKNLARVLAALNLKNFRLSIEKCEYCQTSIPLLGVIIGDGGIKPDTKRVQPIKDSPQPKNLNDTRRFMGMVNYYQPFLPDLATVLEPLRALTRKDVPFQWTEGCEAAFQHVKQLLADNLCVAIFDPNAVTYVTTDASEVGVGAVMSQIQDGKEVPIAFASHTLMAHERRYAATELEAYACVWACEYWDKYLLGRHFILRTDHEALKALLGRFGSGKKANKFHRWFARLAAFDYDVEYRKGSLNQVADALSRMPTTTTTQSAAISDPGREKMIQSVSTSAVSMDRIKVATAEDKTLQTVIGFVKLGWLPRSELTSELQPFYIIKHELALDDGVLTRNHERIIIPAALVKPVLSMAHAGHPGIVRMKRKLRESYWWPQFNNSIEQLVRYCPSCQQSDKSCGPLNFKESMPFPHARSPWERVAIDITGPFFTAPERERFLVVLLDHFSNYPEVLATGDISSRNIIRWLEEIFARLGCPTSLLSDNGPQFRSTEFAEYLKSQGIRHLKTPVYNPQTNGQVEVFNRYLKHGAQTMRQGDKWNDTIRLLLRNYRATALSAKKPSPAEAFLGRKIRLPFEPTRARDSQRTDMASVESPKPPTRARPATTNRGPYKIGDKVTIKRSSCLKGQSPWSKPLAVTAVLGNYTYKLADGQVWNARKIRRYYEPEEATVVAMCDPTPTRRVPRQSSRPTKGRPPIRFSPPP